MVGVDPDMGGALLRIWLAVGAAALLAAACCLALLRARREKVSGFTRSGFVVIGGLLGAIVTWTALERASLGDRDADRRALELRAVELTAPTLQPGSPLPCLSALAGDAVEAACEKALFASPASVAAATSYVSAQLALLTDITGYIRHGGTGIDNALIPLRRSLEMDRFGFVAHALAVRDGCTSQNCRALAVFVNAGRVRANLAAATLDRYLDRYASAWAQTMPEAPLADATAAQPSAAPAPAAPPHKVVDIDFPSAASIPAVSIMNPEPNSKAASAAAANPGPPNGAAAAPLPARRPPPHKQAETASAAPPHKQAEAASTSAPPSVAPVWTPAPAGVLPQSTAASGGSSFASGVMGQSGPSAPQ
jgi:hypothetical protein